MAQRQPVDWAKMRTPARPDARASSTDYAAQRCPRHMDADAGIGLCGSAPVMPKRRVVEQQGDDDQDTVSGELSQHTFLERDAYIRELEASRQALEQLRSEKEALEKSLRDEKISRAQTDLLIKSKEEEIEKLKASLESKSASDAAEVQARLSACEQEKAAQKAELEAQRKVMQAQPLRQPAPSGDGEKAEHVRLQQELRECQNRELVSIERIQKAEDQVVALERLIHNAYQQQQNFSAQSAEQARLVAQFVADNDRLQKENARLKQELEALNAEMAKAFTTMQETIAALSAEYASGSGAEPLKQIQELHAQQEQFLSLQITTLNHENGELKAAIGQEQSRLAALLSDLQNARAEFEALRATNQALQQELQEKNIRLDQCDEQQRAIQLRLATLQEEKARLERDLNRQLELCHEQVRTAKQHEEEKQGELALVQAKLGAITSEKAQSDASIRELEQQLTLARAQLALSQGTHAELSGQLTDLTARLEALGAENTNIVSLLAASNEANEQLQQERRILQSQLNQIRADVESLRARIHVQDLEIVSLQGDLASSQATCDALRLTAGQSGELKREEYEKTLDDQKTRYELVVAEVQSQCQASIAEAQTRFIQDAQTKVATLIQGLSKLTTAQLNESELGYLYTLYTQARTVFDQQRTNLFEIFIVIINSLGGGGRLTNFTNIPRQVIEAYNAKYEEIQEGRRHLTSTIQGLETALQLGKAANEELTQRIETITKRLTDFTIEVNDCGQLVSTEINTDTINSSISDKLQNVLTLDGSQLDHFIVKPCYALSKSNSLIRLLVFYRYCVGVLTGAVGKDEKYEKSVLETPEYMAAKQVLKIAESLQNTIRTILSITGLSDPESIVKQLQYVSDFLRTMVLILQVDSPQNIQERVAELLTENHSYRQQMVACTAEAGALRASQEVMEASLQAASAEVASCQASLQKANEEKTEVLTVLQTSFERVNGVLRDIYVNLVSSVIPENEITLADFQPVIDALQKASRCNVEVASLREEKQAMEASLQKTNAEKTAISESLLGLRDLFGKVNGVLKAVYINLVSTTVPEEITVENFQPVIAFVGAMRAAFFTEFETWTLERIFLSFMGVIQRLKTHFRIKIEPSSFADFMGKMEKWQEDEDNRTHAQSDVTEEHTHASSSVSDKYTTESPIFGGGAPSSGGSGGPQSLTSFVSESDAEAARRAISFYAETKSRGPAGAGGPMPAADSVASTFTPDLTMDTAPTLKRPLDTSGEKELPMTEFGYMFNRAFLDETLGEESSESDTRVAFVLFIQILKTKASFEDAEIQELKLKPSHFIYNLGNIDFVKRLKSTPWNESADHPSDDEDKLGRLFAALLHVVSVQKEKFDKLNWALANTILLKNVTKGAIIAALLHAQSILKSAPLELRSTRAYSEKSLKDYINYLHLKDGAVTKTLFDRLWVQGGVSSGFNRFRSKPLTVRDVWDSGSPYGGVCSTSAAKSYSVQTLEELLESLK